MHLTKEATSSVSLLDHFDKIMPEKKMHEVEKMSKVVRQLCNENDAHFIVDLGKIVDTHV